MTPRVDGASLYQFMFSQDPVFPFWTPQCSDRAAGDKEVGGKKNPSTCNLTPRVDRSGPSSTSSSGSSFTSVKANGKRRENFFCMEADDGRGLRIWHRYGYRRKGSRIPNFDTPGSF